MEKTYMHTGIPVAEKMDGMTYMEGLKVWICNNDEYKIEYLYWERNTPAAWRMIAETHVAYKVADVDAAVKEAIAASPDPAAAQVMYFMGLAFVTIFFNVIPVFSAGPFRAGMTYVIRGFVRREPVFVWHDYITKTRSNLKLGIQAMLINGVAGVIGVKPIHLTKGDESESVPEPSEMTIDIGADSQEEALAAVSYGDSVTFAADFTKNGSTVRSKAIDDRFGCCVLIQLIKSDLPYDADFVFVVQEEVGLRGAKTAAYTVDPQFAIVIEATTSAEIPEIDKQKQVCNLGEGAVISLMDRRTIYDKEMVAMALSTAEKLGVKAQLKRAVAGGNDAGSIHQSRGGVRTLAVSLACRYLHAPDTVASVRDCDSMLELAKALCAEIAGGALPV